jgi:flagellar motor switch protein FliG
MKFALALLFFCAAPGRASVTADETAVSERLSAQADEFLTSLVGPGRGKVVVAVEGEQTQSTFQSESAPASQSSGETRMLMLPGYAKGKENLVKKEPMGDASPAPSGGGRNSQLSSTLESGLQIKRVSVSLVLDSRLTKEQVGVVTNLLPEFLHLDTTRGDQFTVLRADLRADSLKSLARGYLLSKEGVGTVAVLSGIVVLLLLSSVLLHFTAGSAIRTFVREVRSGAPFLRPGADSHELLSGGMPRLDMEEEPRGDASSAPMLGQRFDFLTARSPAELVKLIAAEPPEELALLFATLIASHPDLAASLFAALAPDARGAISQSLAGMTAADPLRLEALENRLKELVNFGLRGPERLGEILSRLPPTERETLVRDVVSSNPAVATELERSLFSFEDVFQLKDSDLRRTISAMPYSDWGLALRGAPGDMVDRILAELDPGTQGMLKATLETPQPRAKILEARSKILTRALLMAAQGEIDLKRESSEMI